MPKLSRKTWLITALVAGVIAAGLIILTEIFPDGNERVTYSNYIRLKEQKQRRRMSVEDVETILGPAARIDVDPNRAEPWVTRFYVGQRERRSMRRSEVTVSFYDGRMFHAEYRYKHDRPLPTKIKNGLVTWFRRLRH